jgi:hypothetical protein
VATVILQTYVQVQGMNSALGQTLLEAVPQIYRNFFTLSSVSLEASIPAIQFNWWLDWSAISIPNLRVDLAFELTAKIAGAIGVMLFLLETILEFVEKIVCCKASAAPSKASPPKKATKV